MEADVAQEVLKPGTQFAGFTPEGLSVLAWAHRYEAECTALRSDLRRRKNEQSMRTLVGRRPVSPKRLQAPDPDAHDLILLPQAAVDAATGRITSN